MFFNEVGEVEWLLCFFFGFMCLEAGLDYWGFVVCFSDWQSNMCFKIELIQQGEGRNEEGQFLYIDQLGNFVGNYEFYGFFII